MRRGLKKRWDVARMAEALKRPGIDPRSWLLMARVDDDPDALRWDTKLGWIVDVTITSPALSGAGPVPCRVASSVSSAGNTKSDPVERDCEVVVLIDEGDPNGNCVIVGQLHNGGGCEAALLVNGLPIVESLVTGTHVLRSAYAEEHQIDGARQNVALSQIITGLTSMLLTSPLGSVSLEAGLGAFVNLGSDDATEFVLKGTVYTSAEATFLAALKVWTQAVASALSAAGQPIVAPQQTLETAIDTFVAAGPTSLSTTTRTD